MSKQKISCNLRILTETEYITIIEELRATNIALVAQNAKLVQEVKILGEKVVMLLKLLEAKGVKKDSHNSHLPPSNDIGGKKDIKSLREPSGKKSGGQPGHSGSTLKMKEVADQVIELKSEYCAGCGSSLEGQEYQLKAKRQVVEIPPIEPIYKEYQQYGCRCGRCGKEQIAEFPEDVKAPIQYGNSIQAMVSYLSVYQYVPYNRLKKMFWDIFGVSLSEGSISNLLGKAAGKAKFVYEWIKTEISESKVVGGDETSAKVNGKKWWVWVWQNALNTYLKMTANRGFQTVAEEWPEGLPKAVMGSDRYGAQLKTSSRGKQLCLAHLLRDVKYLREKERHWVSEEIEKFIKDVFREKKKIVEKDEALERESEEARGLENRLNEMLKEAIVAETSPETAKFQKALIKHRNNLLVCLYEKEVPADNNGSERAIRNVKVKQKVSGQFKSGQGAFCVLRSVIDTLIKRKLDVLTYLNQIMQIQPE